MEDTALNSNVDRELGSLDRRLQAVQLRLAGESFESIAKQLGYASRSGAYKAVKKALQDAEYEAIDDARNLQLQRLEELYREHYPNRTNPRIASLLLDILEREVELLGLKKNLPILAQAQQSNTKIYIGIDPDRV